MSGAHRAVIELTSGVLGALLASAGIGGPSLYFLGRLRAELDRARTDIEAQAARLGSLERDLIETRAEISALTRPIVKAKVAEDTLQGEQG